MEWSCAVTPASAAPSLAACMSPGPPPVMMSQPSSASARATRRVSSYGNVPGLARADPKIVTRYRPCLDGRRRVRLLTAFQRSSTVPTRTCLTLSSSARLTAREPDASGPLMLSPLIRPRPLSGLGLVGAGLVRVLLTRDLGVP